VRADADMVFGGPPAVQRDFLGQEADLRQIGRVLPRRSAEHLRVAAVGAASPASSRSSVVLPAPFSPTSADIRDWHDGNHPGYAFGCWLRDYKEQVFLFTRDFTAPREWTCQIGTECGRSCNYATLSPSWLRNYKVADR
jgi:hypothetical protein